MNRGMFVVLDDDLDIGFCCRLWSGNDEIAH